jgi:hypothetical protein
MQQQQPPPADGDNVRFQAVLDRLGPHNDNDNDDWLSPLDLSQLNLTNRMAQRLGRALLDSNKTLTGLSLSLRSMTPAANEYHLLLQFLATTRFDPPWHMELCSGRLTAHHPGDEAAEEAADERMARTVGILLSALHRNPVEEVSVVITNLSLTPSVVRLATGFRIVYLINCTFNKNHGSNDDDEETEARTFLVTDDDHSAPYTMVKLAWLLENPNIGKLSDIIAGLAQYSSRRLNYLDCDLHDLTNQLVRQFLDLARSKVGRGVHLNLHFQESLTWEPESMEMLTQNHTAIDTLTVTCKDDDDANMMATQSAMLECLRYSTIQNFLFRRLIPESRFTYRNALDGTGQLALANILTRNRLLPQLLAGTSLRTDGDELRPHAIRLALQLQSPHLIKLVFELVRAKVPVLDESSFQSLSVETKKK